MTQFTNAAKKRSSRTDRPSGRVRDTSFVDSLIRSLIRSFPSLTSPIPPIPPIPPTLPFSPSHFPSYFLTSSPLHLLTFFDLVFIYFGTNPLNEGLTLFIIISTILRRVIYDLFVIVVLSSSIFVIVVDYFFVCFFSFFFVVHKNH